jgi:zinc protease
VIALLALLAATPPQMAQRPVIQPLPQLELKAPTTFTLGNGLAVVAVPRHVAPIVALQLVVRSGADADPPAQAGLAAATADMLDEGAGERGALEIARALETLGAELFLGASRDGSTLSLSVPAPAFEAALAIAADVALRPRFAEADWTRVQNDRLTNLIQRRDQPEAVAALVADRVLFGESHPYGRPASGYERTVRDIGVADLRRFHQSHWRAGNATLVVTGDFDPAALRPMLERAFGTWEKGSAPKAKPAPVVKHDRPRLVLVDKPGAPQTVLRLVGPGFSRAAPERPSLVLLATVLGGSFTSRLNFNLREKNGYTYGASASFQFLRRPGPFVASSSVFVNVTDVALGEFLKELNALRTGDVKPEELTKARALQQQHVAEALATTSGTAGVYADLALYGLPLDEPARFLRAIAKADARTLKRVARAVDAPTVTIVAVGDRKVIEPKLRAFGLPAPELRDADGEMLPPPSAEH